MNKLFLFTALIGLSGCYYGPSYAKNPAEQCPSPFWASPEVEKEFMKYEPDSPMRNFYTHYLLQQKAIDNYYTPLSSPARGHNFSGNTGDFRK